jgi:hypothetical protein
MITRPDLPKITAKNRREATPQEVVAIYSGLIANYGTYTVNEANKTITMILEASTYPNQLGFEQKRVLTSVTADELRYYNNAPASDGGGKNLQVFRRIK